MSKLKHFPFVRFFYFISLIVFLLWCSRLGFAADVFYLDSDRGEREEVHSTYPLDVRLRDLVDFTSGRTMEERSGQISGSLVQEFNWNAVGGNKAKSFLREGTDYLSELSLNLHEKLSGDYYLEGQFFARKTDNSRIESRRDIRLKQLTLKVMNPDNIYQFGDFYAELSPFTMSASIEGLGAEVKPSEKVRVKLVAGRKNDADEAASLYQRNVFGVKTDYFLFQGSDQISNFRIGLQAVSSQDDSASLDEISLWTEDLNNTVISTDGEILFTRFFSMTYEMARSFYLADEDAAVTDSQAANALRIQPQIQFGKATLWHTYNYVEPDFFTDNGSAYSDRAQHQTVLDYRFNEKATLSAMTNYYWDRLDGSSRTKRTVTDEKTLTLNLRPFTSRQRFNLRTFIGHTSRDSDDPQNSAESATRSIGFSVNDALNDKMNYGFSYEYRGFTDQAARLYSDYFHRIGFNFSQEFLLLGRRFYYSLNPSVDLRTTKLDENKDVNLRLNFYGQYELSPAVMARFGHNIVERNSARVSADYMNNRSFAELTWKMDKTNSRHFIVRWEQNQFIHEDGTQSYQESRVISKFVINF